MIALILLFLGNLYISVKGVFMLAFGLPKPWQILLTLFCSIWSLILLGVIINETYIRWTTRDNQAL